MNWGEKTILITGATGSFGSSFCKHLLSLNAKKIIVFSRGWLAQQQLRNELGNPSHVRWFIGDVRDKSRLMRAFKDVSIVIHAAAIKDIDACSYNPFESVITNVIGTKNVIDACIDHKVEKCLFISTDKAVNAINTYGMTKALAENLWINANKYAADDNIKFSVCRYGNVIGSNGSVVPLFKKLIAGGVTELPITHPEMTRFFFKMQYTLSFVQDSLEIMQGGETFIPKLPSVRITDLCKAFTMPYKVIGIRENEKLHEELEPGKSSLTNDWFLTVDEIKEWCDIP